MREFHAAGWMNSHSNRTGENKQPAAGMLPFTLKNLRDWQRIDAFVPIHSHSHSPDFPFVISLV
jgi:hypothetical protein